MKQKCTLKKLLSLMVSVCISSATVHAQWSPIASMGTGPTDGCFSFALHGKGYVGGGSNGSKFYAYDSLANTWTLKGNAPGSKIRGFGFSFVANGKGYAGGGDTTGMNNPTADMWMYNDTTATWTKKASFPGGGRDAMFSFVINDTAYVGGGFDAAGSGWNDFYKYNPFTDTWTALPALSMGAVGFPVSFVLNNKGYIATGQVGPAESAGLWEYDPVTNAWTAKASLPGVPRQAAFGFSLAGYGYVGGGMASYDTEYYDMWRYAPASNSWTSVAAFPSAYPAWSCVFTIGSTAFIGTGTYFDNVTPALISTDSFKKYHGAVNPALNINQQTVVQQIKVYPNPANGFIYMDGNVDVHASIIITDITGRELKTFTNTSGLYIGDLQKGMYLLKCISDNEVYTGRFIKE